MITHLGMHGGGYIIFSISFIDEDNLENRRKWDENDIFQIACNPSTTGCNNYVHFLQLPDIGTFDVNIDNEWKYISNNISAKRDEIKLISLMRQRYKVEKAWNFPHSMQGVVRGHQHCFTTVFKCPIHKCKEIEYFGKFIFLRR